MEGAPTERQRIWLRLDREPEVFRPHLAEFLDALGERLDVEPAVLNVVDIRSGCVILVIEAPIDVAERLLSELRPSARPQSSDDPLTRDWGLQGARPDEPERLGAFTQHRRQPPAVTWLHLSDLHVSAGDEHQDRWMGTVERDLPVLLRERDLNPDFVIVSGDIANSGQTAEYEQALDFLARLRERLPHRQAPTQWVLAPGNHDVEWAAVDSARELELRKRFQKIWDEDELNQAITAPDTQRYLLERQANYRMFAASANATLDSPTLRDDNTAVLMTTVADIEIGVAALNSSLLSTRKDYLKATFPGTDVALPDLDLQALAVGQRSLSRAAGAVEDCDVRIAVLHHPPLSEWFHSADQLSQRSYLGQFDFVHRGHEHLPSQTRRALAGLNEDVFEVATGALHVSEKWYRGFCAVSIDAARKFVNTHYFAYGMRANRWIPDVETAAGGLITTRLPKTLGERLTPRRSA